jgi:hypothetical protein
MPNPTIRIHNLETNQVEDRKMTDAEYADYVLALEETTKNKLVEAKKETQKEALLSKLGITAEEAALLLA